MVLALQWNWKPLWESRAAFEAWTTSDAFRQGHARSGTLPKDAFSGPNVLEIHEVVAR